LRELSIAELFTRIRQNMPVAVTAYVLQLNKLAAGTRGLDRENERKLKELLNK